jgi:hypothetical protein
VHFVLRTGALCFTYWCTLFQVLVHFRLRTGAICFTCWCTLFSLDQWFPNCAPRIPWGPRPFLTGSVDTFP